jgi:hypothetical protein
MAFSVNVFSMREPFIRFTSCLCGALFLFLFYVLSLLKFIYVLYSIFVICSETNIFGDNNLLQPPLLLYMFVPRYSVWRLRLRKDLLFFIFKCPTNHLSFISTSQGFPYSLLGLRLNVLLFSSTYHY